MWKQRLGSDATYKKLINVFESAGHHNYANIVRNIACHGGVKSSEIDDLSDYAEPFPQPETYPHQKPSPLSPKLETHKPSFCDEFLLLNSTAARDLPGGKNCINIYVDWIWVLLTMIMLNNQ